MFEVRNLDLLREELIKNGVDAYLIFTTDPHNSEYAASYFLSERLFLCPFTGSAGQVLITRDRAFLWADGRYWIQAEKELEGSTIELMKFGDPKTPSLTKEIKELGLNKVATNFEMLTQRVFNDFKSKNINLVDFDFSILIKDRPALSKEKVFSLDAKLFSQTPQEKINEIYKKMKELGAEANIVTTLDDIAWILNIRGNDVPCNPVFYSYLYLSESLGNYLFIDKDKIDFDIEGINILPYEKVYEFLANHKKYATLVDFSRANARICNVLDNKINAKNPSFLMKAIKGKVEVENTKRIQEIDGLALVKFWKYLDSKLEDGSNEFELGERLKDFRLEREECFDLSFETIAAVDANAAQMHYSASEDKFSEVTKDNMMLLVDSGGQYYGGTTDTTRMFNFGKLTKEYCHDYTLTLKSLISLTKAKFLEGVGGVTIDMKARQVMWDEGLDYKCGTGHGVGYILNVHEGPNAFRPVARDNAGPAEAIVPGMITTVEPGVYKNNKYGIRIENNLVCVEDRVTDDGRFFKFETITYVPIDTRGLDLDILTDDEIEWLNEYHKDVFERLSKLTDDAELLAFLKEKTMPVSKTSIIVVKTL